MKNLVIFSSLLLVVLLSCKKEEEEADSLQTRLNNGESTVALINEFPADSFYTKSYAGGYIFHIETDGTGMVVSKFDNNEAAYFGCPTTGVGSTSPDFGSGKTNTADIVAVCSDYYSAARICDTIVVNGYSDWYLPSEMELVKIFNNVHSNGVGDFAENYYWSSTESSGGARRVLFMDGSVGVSTKTNSHYVRAVRNF